jgi:hypothetical protein
MRRRSIIITRSALPRLGFSGGVAVPQSVTGHSRLDIKFVVGASTILILEYKRPVACVQGVLARYLHIKKFARGQGLVSRF